jgi:hypothetical protein
VAVRCAVSLLVCAPFLLLRSPSAHACSCSDRVVGISWPRSGVSDIALDAPLVATAFRLDQVEAALLAEDGSRVELVERRRLEAGSFACSSISFAFFTPSQPLQPQTHYLFSVKNDGPGPILAGGQPSPSYEASSSFVTGTELRVAPPSNIALHVFGADLAWQRLLEVYLETDSSEPLFAIANAKKNGHVTRGFDPLLIAERPFHVSLGGVKCADVTLVDVAGQTVSSVQRCQPDKCARPSITASDSCGEEEAPSLSWTDWQALPDGCGAAEPASGVGRSTVIASAAQADLEPRSSSEAGCALASDLPRRAGGTRLLWLAPVLFWRSRVSRKARLRAARPSPG